MNFAYIEVSLCMSYFSLNLSPKMSQKCKKKSGLGFEPTLLQNQVIDV